MSSWSSPYDPKKKEKLFTRESSQQAKEERKIFLDLLLTLQLNKLEGKARINFFGFSQG